MSKAITTLAAIVLGAASFIGCATVPRTPEYQNAQRMKENLERNGPFLTKVERNGGGFSGVGGNISDGYLMIDFIPDVGVVDSKYMRFDDRINDNLGVFDSSDRVIIDGKRMTFDEAKAKGLNIQELNELLQILYARFGG